MTKLTATWTSGGQEKRLVRVQEEGEEFDDFVTRFLNDLADQQQQFPPDP